MPHDTNWVHLERDIEAAVETVWAMWTDPAKFQDWYGPMGAKIPVAEMDLTVGGTRKTCMEMQMQDRTMTMWFTGQFKEISAPTRLVYTEAMCDPDGNLLPPSAMGMPGDAPNITDVIVSLQDRDGKTHLTLEHHGVPAGSPGEKGWDMALDGLAAALA